MSQKQYDFTGRVLEFFKENPGTRLKPKKLRTTLNISQRDYPQLRDTVKNLALEGKLKRYQGNVYGLPGHEEPSETIGVLDIHARGFGFVNTKDGKKIFIHAGVSGSSENKREIILKDLSVRSLNGDGMNLSAFFAKSGDIHWEFRKPPSLGKMW